MHGLGRKGCPDARDQAHLMSAKLLVVGRPLHKRWPLWWHGDQGDTPMCFPPGTMILMADNTEKPIEQVCPGEYVRTHTGQAKLVLLAMTRRYQGPLALIHVGALKEPLRSTPEHPYYISRFRIQDKRSLPDRGQLQWSDTIWRSSEELKTDHFHRGRDYVHLSGGTQSETVIEEGSRIDLARFFSSDGYTITEDTIRAGGAESRHRIPRYIRATYDLMKLIGLYLAEGSARPHGGELQFSLGSHEDKIVEDIRRITLEIFDQRLHKALRPTNCLIATGGGKTLKMLFLMLGGHGCDTKRLHPWLFQLSPTLLLGIWEGFRIGDGYQRERNGSIETHLVTVSQQLARDLFRIGLMIGKSPSLHYSDPKPSHRVKTRRRRYSILSYSSPSRWPLHDLHKLVPVKRVTHEQYDGLVFNLEVEGDRSYIANFAVVHNCVGYGWHGLLRAYPHLQRDPMPIPLYHQAQVNDEFRGEDYEGSSVRGGAKALKLAGKLTNYAWAFDLETVLNWIGTHGPVVLGTDWYDGMMTADATGLVAPSGDLAGGHAYVAIGYDDPSHRLLCQNSWGKDWGVNGRFYMHYEDISALIATNGEACTPTE